ncbi:MAG TPA: SAM-dependent methyltransferase [Amycolatopsis sp.]|uniref:SAM-dependent methyltransferase n=1 Tax=Amycolatopsis sp. TaxID=37632 RepID=UPI002B462E3E|nr:SAM-dependent methyltransferase [Amycolatopsis sp.]HKS45981.1 SAM-dependent methyltransferase [Amycolatopsis sp.]
MTGDDEVLRALEGSIDRPSAARVYDYFLGGTNHYAIDREFAEMVLAKLPKFGDSARTCRQFLGRAVRYCALAGIRQFVDIGSGLPTQGNVHEVADAARPEEDTRVVYIDNEPIALAHSKVLLADTADPHRHRAIAGDLLQAPDLWQRVLETGVIDEREPVGLVINAVLHFIGDDQEPGKALEFYRDRLAPGSMLVLSHVTMQNPVDSAEREGMEEVAAYYERTTNPGRGRTSEEFARFFGDWVLEEPGLVYAPAWHPDAGTISSGHPERTRILAGVARKPRPST